ncbi:putative Ig domain-containing protein [Methylobacterium sp. 092160098-2]|uniref:putative Ig domain-containing protein n=1 Tax=Methylobacterium sp. 092160098-2 TaxID=3025129 RepID=UPI002381B43A|nr:putative Ig domain-containing protein [Methylobacterium sp. 092160098-2]MDE4914879.1 putative Ig domain-containing protein [Methylobacterium sp. 092160098-2]
MLRRATAFLLCALTALPPQTALAATAVFRSPTPAAQSTTPMVMSSNVPQGRIDDPYLAQFRATGGVPPYTYELVAGSVPTGTAFNPSTGDISGTPPVSGTYSGIRIRASDQNGSTATSLAYTIVISGRPLSLTANIPLTGVLGQPYSGSVTAKGGTKPLAYTIYSGALPDGLDIDTGTGAIAGVPTARGTRTFSVRVLDSSKPTSNVATTAQQSISIDGAPLAVNCPPCQGVQTAVGNAYDATFVATGGQGPYSYHVQSGRLPPGISLDTATGRLSGTPTAAGTYPDIVVQVSDADSRYVLTSPFRFAVQGNVTVSGVPAAYATLGENYSAAFQAAGGREPYGWTMVGGLPPGLALDPASGSIGGTPTALGSYGGLQAAAADADGRTAASKPFAISVATPLTLSGSAPDATVGTAYRTALAADGGRAPYVFSLVSGPLPPGLVLGTSGTLAGTPTAAGNYEGIVVRAVDADGRSAVRGPLAIAVAAPLQVSANPPAAVVGDAVDYSATASGGTGPYTCSLASGPLPPGIRQEGAGSCRFLGTATVEGTYPVAVAAVDARGRTAVSETVDWRILGALAVRGAPATVGTVGMPYSALFEGVGGTSPYRWSVAAGVLPSGLTLTAAGSIAGTPTAAGVSSGLRMRVTDAAGRTGLSAIFSIAVGQPLAVDGSPSPRATVGTAYSATFTASGGRGPYVFGPGVGTLPAGLSIDPSGLLAGLPTTAETRTDIQVRAIDADGRVAYSPAFRIAVSDRLTIAGVPPSSSTAGEAYAFSFQAGGGAKPYVFSVASGSLPTGLTLSPAGSISGATTAAGTWSDIRVSVSDPDGRTAFGEPFAISVQAPLAISGTPSSAGTIGRPYSAQFAASGGRGPYVFSSAGTLPDGIVLDPVSGTLAGSPSVGGTYAGLVVTVADSDGRTASTSPFAISVTGGLAVDGTPPTFVVRGEHYQGTLSATGGTAPYAFSLGTGTLPPGVALASDGTLDGYPTEVGTYSFRARATDAAGVSAMSRQFDVQVLDVLRLVGDLPENWDLGVAGEYLFRATGGRGPYVFSVDPGTPLPPGLAIDPATGRISGTPTQTGEYYSRRIAVTDADGRTAGGQWYMSVQEPISAWIDAIPPATLGQPFTVDLHCSGPRFGCGFSSRYVPNRLPPGLSITSDAADPFLGHISGTPTSAGQYSGAGIWVSDSNGRAAYIDGIDILVLAPVSVTANWTSYGVVGQSYASTFSASGGRSPLTFSLATGTLPDGLVLDPDSGRISGTPTREDTQSGIRVRATDPDGRSGTSAAFALTIGLPLTISGSAPSTGAVGTPFSGQFTAAGGRKPYSYALAGSLPDGLKLAPSSGLISGTPTTAITVTNISVSATDSDGRKASTQPFSIAISGPLAVAGTPSTVGRVGSAYIAVFAASGGTGPYTFALASGALPSGLSLSSTGRITGAPTVGGTFSYAVAATDAAGATASTPTFQLTVNAGTAPLAIGSVPEPYGTVGQAYESRYFGIEGTAPYAYAIASGALPDGLILADDGRVIGLPTTKGVYTFQVSVTDAAGQTARTADQTIDVADPLVLSEEYRDIRAMVGDSGDMDLGATGGTAPYTVQVAQDYAVLPPGIRLDADHLRLYGTYAVASQGYASTTFKYTVVDAVGRTTTVGTIWFYIGPAMIVDPPLDRVYVKGVQVPVYWFNYKPSSRPAGGQSPWTVEYSTVGEGAQFPTGFMENLQPAGDCGWNCGLEPGTSYFGWPGHAPSPVTDGYSSFYWTPSGTGAFGPVRITLRDSQGRVATAVTPTVTVVDPFTFVEALPDAFVGKAYSVDLRTLGGLAPYAYAKISGILPEGLVLDAATGLISGIPTRAAGSYERLQFAVDWADHWFRDVRSPAYTLKVVDPDARPAGPLAVAVVGGNPPARVLKGRDDGESNDVDETVNRTFVAAGGVPPYSFSLAPGSAGMPLVCRPEAWWCSPGDADDTYKVPALAVDATGLFSRVRIGYNPGYGTVYKAVPAGRISDIRIRVTDSTGAAADSAPFAIDFRKPVGLGGSFPANLVVGDVVDMVATAADGWEPIVLTDVALPPGLSATISGRGVAIKGTVTTPGTYVGSIAIRDDFPSNATWSFSTTVRRSVDPLALQSPGDVTVTAGDYFSVRWQPQGGVAPYWVKLLSGSLPDGTALDAGGYLEGTAPSPGTWSDIVLQVVDAAGRTAVADPVTITVQSSATTAPSTGECQDGSYCGIRFTAGIPLFEGPIAPNVPISTIVEAHSPYYRAPGMIGGTGDGTTPETRYGPDAGDPSILTFQLVNAPSWLTWTGPAVVGSIDDGSTPWWGYFVNGYYNQRTAQAVPPAPGSANDQTGYTPGPYEGGGGSGGGSGGGLPGGPPVIGLQ